MNPESGLLVSVFPEWALIAGGFLSSFLITFSSIPTIVKIAKHRKLFDTPNERASHSNSVPVLGGLSIFAGITVTMAIMSSQAESSAIKYLTGAMIVLFFLGLKDDVLILDPKKKFLGQILASCIVIILGDVRIIEFHSIFGIESISYLPSVVLSLLLFLTLINGFNLIDGVDGLSSGAGILGSLFLGIWFLSEQQITWSVISFALAGALMAYFWFNVFGTKNKIFMGDTGSMLTGITIAFLTVKFLEYNGPAGTGHPFPAAPAVAFSLLILPLFDTLRVFIIRIFSGQSPFKADKRHVHHILLEYGMSHLRVTICLLSINIFFLAFSLIFQNAGSFVVIIIVMTILSGLVMVLRHFKPTFRTSVNN